MNTEATIWVEKARDLLEYHVKHMGPQDLKLFLQVAGLWFDDEANAKVILCVVDALYACLSDTEEE